MAAWVASKRHLPLETKIDQIWNWASKGATGHGHGDELTQEATVRLAKAVDSHQECVWSRDEGRRLFIRKGHCVRGLHNDGRIGTADRSPNEIGITVRLMSLVGGHLCACWGVFDGTCVEFGFVDVDCALG